MITIEFDTDDREIEIHCSLPREFSPSYSERRYSIGGITMLGLATICGILSIILATISVVLGLYGPAMGLAMAFGLFTGLTITVMVYDDRKDKDERTL